MKFRLIQFTMLLVFVMSVIFMARAPNGFGDSPSYHKPNFYVDGTGKKQTGGTIDPRGESFNNIIINGQNGSEHVEAEGWYYRGGILSGTSGTNEHEHDPEDHEKGAPRHQVYKLVIKCTASAWSSSVSASVMPSIEEINALPVAQDRFGGVADISLKVLAVNYHEPQYSIWDFEFTGCEDQTAEGGEYDPASATTIEIVVKPVTSTDTTGMKFETSVVFDGGIAGGNAKVENSESWSSSRTDLQGYGYGVSGSITGSGVFEKQQKAAIAEGSLEDAEASVFANFAEVKSWCPTDKYGYRVGRPRVRVVHHSGWWPFW